MPSNGRPRRSPYARRNEPGDPPTFTCSCGKQEFVMSTPAPLVIQIECAGCHNLYSVGQLTFTLEGARS